jgi:hypothetical protein
MSEAPKEIDAKKLQEIFKRMSQNPDKSSADSSLEKPRRSGSSGTGEGKIS